MDRSDVMLRVLLLACLLIGGLENRAFAQAGSVVLLPTRGDERLPAQREAAQQALSEALSLQGFSVVPHATALTQLPPGATACGAVDCAPNLLRTLSMRVAAACAVWLSPDAPEGTVFVTLVDDAGARYPGARSVHAANIAVATRAALADARALQMLGPGPWVRVHGEPEGAKVFIDNTLVGTVPYRAAMTAGRYELKVQAAGHVSDVQDLDIPLNDGRVVDVEVKLNPGEDPIDLVATSPVSSGDAVGPQLSSHPANDGTDGARVAQVGDYMLGAALAIPGVLLMTIDPIRALAKHGDCADSACRTVYTFGTRTALELVGGAALVTAGAVVAFVWKPFSIRVGVGPDASLQLSTRF